MTVVKPVSSVTPIEGEPYRFFVESSVFGAPPHLVNLLGDKGRGECDCADYVCRRKKLRNERETNPGKIFCRHIRACQIAWARLELRRIAAERLQRYGQEFE